jgi:hypothetical protein
MGGTATLLILYSESIEELNVSRSLLESDRVVTKETVRV